MVIAKWFTKPPQQPWAQQGLATHGRETSAMQESSTALPGCFLGSPRGSSFTGWSDHFHVILASREHSDFRILQILRLFFCPFFHLQLGNPLGSWMWLLVPKVETATCLYLLYLHIIFPREMYKKLVLEQLLCDKFRHNTTFHLHKFPFMWGLQDKNYMYHQRTYVKILSVLWNVTVLYMGILIWCSSSWGGPWGSTTRHKLCSLEHCELRNDFLQWASSCWQRWGWQGLPDCRIWMKLVCTPAAFEIQYNTLYIKQKDSPRENNYSFQRETKEDS